MRRSPLSLSFTRDRADGGGGDDGDENFDDGPGSGATDRQRRAAAGDDDADDADDDAGSDDGDDGDDDDGDEKLRDEGKRALEAERQKVKDLRKQLREAKKGAPTDAPKDGKPTPEIERARLDGESAAVATWKPLVVNTAAAGKLAQAGLVGSPDRLVKMLDLDEIDVDPTDGSIDGLDEQISDLKKDYPMLFRRTTGRRIDSADRGERNRKPMDATERQAEQLRSGGF